METDMTREEAIKEIKSWDFLNKKETEAIETLIPELRESEDERIRRTLVEYFGPEVQLDFVRGVPIQKIRAWLEKQKAKERLDRMAPIYNDKESFEVGLEKAWKYYNESASRTVDSFEDDYIECVFSKGFREGFLYREKQKEQKPEWSEEDKYILKNIHDFVKENTINPNRVNCAKECLNWLNSLPERFNLQPKTEWSEEDKKRIKQLIYDTEFIKAHYEKRKEELGKQFNNILIEDCDEQIAWLKSLRP